MKNLWSNQDARAYVRRYGGQGVNADVARRVYTTRLLGGDPRLVLHGGGNTSVKTVATDITGEVIDVRGEQLRRRARVKFRDHGTKDLVLQYARLTKRTP